MTRLRSALMVAVVVALSGCDRDTLLGYQLEPAHSDGGVDPRGINPGNDAGFDGGNPCEWYPAGLGLVPATTVVSFGDFCFAGSTGGRVYRTSNLTDWDTLSLPNASDNATASIVGPDGFIIGTDHATAAVMVDDGGFEALDTQLPTYAPIHAFAVVTSGTLVGTANGTYRVQSSGGWTPGTLAREDGGIMDVMSLYGSPPVVVAGTREDGMYRSGDDGQTWQHVGPSSIVPISTNGIVGIARAGNFVFAGGDVFLASDDDGQSWQDLTNRLPNGGGKIVALTADGTKLYIALVPPTASTTAMIYWSTDGTDWTQLGSAISDGPVASLALYAGQLVAGTTQNGVYAYPLACNPQP